MKNFTDIKDISKGDIEDILTRTRNEKRAIKEEGTCIYIILTDSPCM